MPLRVLRDPGIVRREPRIGEHPPLVLTDVAYFAFDGVKVWGATAMILAEFLAVLGDVDAEGTARFR